MDKEFTRKFIEMNEQFVHDKERISKFPPKAVAIYMQFANGRCFCGKKIFVTNFIKTGAGAEWIFLCGHKLTAISLKENKNKNTPGDVHYRSELVLNRQSEVNVQMSGERQNKEESEYSVVKLLCHMHKNNLQKFSQPETDSPIDVIGEDSKGNKEFFQVTKLYNQNFWHQLGKHEKASIELKNNVTVLIKEAINRKLTYPLEIRKSLVLVIDCGVGLLKTDVDLTEINSISIQSGFKEIWLVGKSIELTYKLHPFN
jgi:hypothetical protein